MINSGVVLWNRAKQIIPGGNQLLSKRSDMFLPDYWPSYYKKAKGVEVWDLDNNHYIDMSIMGIGACSLGYADEDVNKAVIDAVNNGSMCTLNCHEEVELAELLLKIDPWAGMVRFARTGGEAVAIAVRIARAFSKKDKILFCGYHGWHDWYLSSNLADDKNLDGHLLPGLNPLGVPRELRGNAIPFKYDDTEKLRELAEKHKTEIGAIVMEPVRNLLPENNFLKEVRKIADEIGAVLIFDEISSGWRLAVGGAYSLYGVNPDIVTYSKALGNGHPIAAVVGKKEIMNVAQETFISSTYWSERVGYAAALASIAKMNRVNSPAHLIKIGELIGKNWKECASANNINIEVAGIPPMAVCVFKYDEQTSLQMQTIFTQEMLSRGFLASPHIKTAYKHTPEIIEKYTENVDEVFKTIGKGLSEGNLKNLLKGPVATKGFKRLN